MGKEPTDSSHLAVLAVRAEPPTGVPGGTVTFELLHSDEVAPPAGGARPMQIAWLGGCHNPPEGQYFSCYPDLRSTVTRFASAVLDTPPDVLSRASAGLGTTFSMAIPEDIAARGYGVSFAFFAVCTGRLVPAPEREDTVPLDCREADGKSIDRSGFAVGFTTVYTIPGLSNHNPVIEGIDFDGVPLDASACGTDTDCPLAEQCQDARCMPVLTPCAEPGCHRLTARIDPASAEPTSTGRETLELRLLGPAIDTSRRLRGDGSTWFGDLSFPIDGPSAGATDTVSLWLITRDDRGGVGWTERTFLVEPPG
jgi:hypothetical protein